MKTLEVTDEQHAFIQRLREEISTDVVGKYGFVRERDAVQFLIDNLSNDVDIDDEVDFSATDDVAASVDAAIEGEDDPHELETVSYDERTAEGTGTDSTAESEADSTVDTEADPTESSESDASDAEDVEDIDGTQDAADTDSMGSDSGAADDDDMLDEMMSLLETHDDKWEESASGDYRYTVTLSDGSTEDVQTKDDVRALLFKNYR